MAYNGLPIGRLRDIVEFLGAHTLPMVEAVFAPDQPGRGRCVLVSHIVRDCLHRLGYPDATCLPCMVRVNNALGAQYQKESMNLSPEASERLAESYASRGGHILEIGHPDDPDTAGGWSGHLVCVVSGFLLDFVLEQFSRPAKGIILGPVAAPLWHMWPWADGDCLSRLSHDNGATIEWRATPGNRRYESGRAAQYETYAPVLSALEAIVRKSLYPPGR